MMSIAKIRLRINNLSYNIDTLVNCDPATYLSSLGQAKATRKKNQ